ncbi:MAG: hypothetical protein ABW321_29445 [Polyangiales bacterium]
MIVILRASGPKLTLDNCLQWLPRERVVAAWRRGDIRPQGAVLEQDGFNVELGDFEPDPSALSRALTFLDDYAAQLKALVADGNHVEIDIGIEVLGQLPASLRLNSEHLAKIVSVGAALSVSAYPEEEEEEGALA